MKKLLSLLLIASMPALTISAFEQNQTSSVSLPSESEWAVEYVEKAKNIGIAEKDKPYRYLRSITREEFCELIYNYYQSAPESVTASYDNVNFADTDNEHIRMLSSLGIINGISETEFAPNALLTREEAATIIFRLINTAHPDWAAHELYFDFADSNEISDWAADNIQVICNMGIMNGIGNGKFAPKNNLTTEQAVTVLVRCYENFTKSGNVIGGGNEETDIVISDISFADKLNMQMPRNENYMFSPMSVKTALALTANGADGKTKSEILDALGIENIDDFNAFSIDLIEKYSKCDFLNLNIANSVWINKDQINQNFSNTFKKTATVYYNADVETVDDKNAVPKINSWVSEKTNGKITQIVQNADDIEAMLINAIYFKGAWKNKFSENATKPDEFTSADGKKSQIDFMNKTAWINFSKTESAEIIELPYQNRSDNFNENGEYTDTEYYDDLDVSMYVISADSEINIAQTLETAINNNSFERTFIKLSMPKFKIEYSGALNDMLKNIGIKQAFDPYAAQFEKMVDSGNVFLRSTIHKTYIDVDEKGTEAAAVTAIMAGGTSSLLPEPKELKFNKPFYFAIRDNTSGEILFMGKFAYSE